MGNSIVTKASSFHVNLGNCAINNIPYCQIDLNCKIPNESENHWHFFESYCCPIVSSFAKPIYSDWLIFVSSKIVDPANIYVSRLIFEGKADKSALAIYPL